MNGDMAMAKPLNSDHAIAALLLHLPTGSSGTKKGIWADLGAGTTASSRGWQSLQGNNQAICKNRIRLMIKKYDSRAIGETFPHGQGRSG